MLTSVSFSGIVSRWEETRVGGSRGRKEPQATPLGPAFLAYEQEERQQTSFLGNLLKWNKSVEKGNTLHSTFTHLYSAPTTWSTEMVSSPQRV